MPITNPYDKKQWQPTENEMKGLTPQQIEELKKRLHIDEESKKIYWDTYNALKNKNLPDQWIIYKGRKVNLSEVKRKAIADLKRVGITHIKRDENGEPIAFIKQDGTEIPIIVWNSPSPLKGFVQVAIETYGISRNEDEDFEELFEGSTVNLMKCPKCGYEWEPKTDKPKRCPKCRAYL